MNKNLKLGLKYGLPVLAIGGVAWYFLGRKKVEETVKKAKDVVEDAFGDIPTAYKGENWVNNFYKETRQKVDLADKILTTNGSEESNLTADQLLSLVKTYAHIRANAWKKGVSQKSEIYNNAIWGYYKYGKGKDLTSDEKKEGAVNLKKKFGVENPKNSGLTQAQEYNKVITYVKKAKTDGNLSSDIADAIVEKATAKIESL